MNAYDLHSPCILTSTTLNGLQFPLQETNERLERDLREIRSMAASGGMLSVVNIVSFMLKEGFAPLRPVDTSDSRCDFSGDFM